MTSPERSGPGGLSHGSTPETLPGRPGIAWSDEERAEWKRGLIRRRSYADDVVARIDALRDRFDVEQYGALERAADSHPLYALRSRSWNNERPLVLVTGGVHGYETSGVMGALQFLEQHASQHAEADLLVAPCVSPWAYERVQRWNADAIDPNRSFRPDTSVTECAALMKLVQPVTDRVVLHIDLHETTDSDETEFRPALAARDGLESEPGEIPDGFYLCGDTAAPELAFQSAIIDAVSRVTHIAPSDHNGQIIETDVVARGVILYPMREFGLSASITSARFRTLTEVYPDSPRTSPSECNDAQVAAVRAAIAYALAH
jgi:hypothetical protein